LHSKKNVRDTIALEHYLLGASYLQLVFKSFLNTSNLPLPGILSRGPPEGYRMTAKADLTAPQWACNTGKMQCKYTAHALIVEYGNEYLEISSTERNASARQFSA